MYFASRAPTLLLLALAVLVSVTNWCQAEDELIIVSPHWEGIQYEFGRAFEAHYQDKFGKKINVRWRDLGGTSQIEKAIDAGYAADPKSCKIDVFFGGGIDPFESQKEKGQLHPYRLPESILNSIPSEIGGFPIIDPDYTFYGAALSSFGILENRKVLESISLPEVHQWEDLAHPGLLSWVSSADPRKSGSVHMIYEIILQAYGWERGWAIIYQMSGNVRSFLQSSSAPTKEVSTGDAAYAVSIDINGMTQQAFLGKENVRFMIPKGVSVINPDGIAILKGAPNLPQAEAFMNFVMSIEGQSLWMKPQGNPDGAVKFGITRMGVIPEMYSGDMTELLVPINPFTQKYPFTYSSETGSKRWGVINDLIGQTIIDVHSHLRAAWSAICALPEDQREALIDEFSSAFVSEAEAEEYTTFWRTDKIRARQISNDLMTDAVARFNQIEEKALKLSQP
ncbi:MAG: extracellular solute-binding protein [Verrucomicrobiota bacterium]